MCHRYSLTYTWLRVSAHDITSDISYISCMWSWVNSTILWYDHLTCYDWLEYNRTSKNTQVLSDTLHQSSGSSCKGVHSLMPDLSCFGWWRTCNCNSALDSTRGMNQRGKEGIERVWNELRRDWRTPSWRLGIRTSRLLIHSARGHIGPCYRTNR